MNDLLRNKRLLAVAGAILVLIIAIVLVVAFNEDEGDSPQQQQAENENVNQDEYPGMTEAQIKEIRGVPDEYTARHKLSRTEILKREADDYRWRAQFPDHSFPVTRDYDPVKSEFTPSQPMTTHPDHPNGPFLVQYLDKISHSPDEPLVIHAFLLDEEKQKMKTSELEASLTIGGAQGRILANMSMSDSGGTGDVRDDLIYTAAFTLPSNLGGAGAVPTNYVVIVKYKDIATTNTFSVGNLNIKHTGSYTDKIHTDDRGAHLLVEPEFEVGKAGYFHVQATIYARNGDAIGLAQNRVKLDTGKQKVPLIFYGKLICDKGVNGPYIFKHMAYQNVELMPGVRSELVQSSYQTAPYQSSQFTCASFDHPDYTARAQQAEQDALEEKNNPGGSSLPRAE